MLDGGKIMQRTTEVALPTLRVVPNPFVGGYGRVESIGWTLPIDDTHYRIYTAGRVREKGVFLPKGVGAATNRKRWIDMTPEERREVPGDWEAQVGQGAITFHSDEHLATSDQGMVMLRRVLHRQVNAVAERARIRWASASTPLRRQSSSRLAISSSMVERPAERPKPVAALPPAADHGRPAVAADRAAARARGGDVLFPPASPQGRDHRTAMAGDPRALSRRRDGCHEPGARSYLLAPSLSRILKDLEAAEHVRRRAGRDDSRQSLVSLSPKGAAMVTRAAPFLDGIHREIARRFGRDRVEELLALLAELETALAEPPPQRKPQEAATMTRPALAFVSALLLLAIAPSAHGQGKYDPGVSDSEIKLGQTAPYSGRSRPTARSAARRSPTSP